MISKSARIKIHDLINNQDPPRGLEKLEKVIKSVKRYHAQLVSPPVGCHPCNRCKSIDNITFASKNPLPYQSPFGTSYEIAICGRCRGSGYLLWTKMAMHEDGEVQELFLIIPLSLLSRSSMESSATLFYLFFFNNPILEEEVSFDFTNCKDPYARKFANYFISYKQDLENRRKFISNNLTKLRQDFLELTKVPEKHSRKSLCSLCQSQPFNIIPNIYNDILGITVCGKCYGNGYQAKRDTEEIVTHYWFKMSHLPYQEDKVDMRAILKQAGNLRDKLTTAAGMDLSKNIPLKDSSGCLV